MRKILITNQSTGYLTTEIANAFVHSGNFEKVVIASGNEISPLLKLDKSIYIEQMPAYKKNSIFSRTLSWIKGAIWIVYMARGKYRDYELFLISNPPTVTFSSLFINNKYSTLIYDVYPNGLADCGFISKHNIIYK